MFDNSMIRKTSQWWKVRLGFVVMMIGLALMTAGEYFLKDMNHILIPIGSLIGFCGMIFLAITIKCPFCKAKWIWIIASKRNALKKWGGPLFAHEI